VIEPGWYPDPDNSLRERFWTGSGWAAQVRTAPGVLINPNHVATAAQMPVAYSERSHGQTSNNGALTPPPARIPTKPTKAFSDRVIGWAVPLGIGLILVAISYFGGGSGTVPPSNVLETGWQSGNSDVGGNDNDWQMGVDGTGYSVTCQDGSTSLSGGRQGACSHHGGVR
jgi:hypothetical protein